jgi:hypothetical protein
MGVVHVAVEDEGVDAGFVRHLEPRVAVGRSLHGLARRAIRRVKALLTQDHPSIASLELEFGLPEKLPESRKVAEGDSRSGLPIGLGTGIPPGARIEEVFRVGMKRQMPVVVPARSSRLGELFEKGAPREDLSLLAAWVGDVPMMFQ